jgi:hypothetical protein
MDSVEKFGRSNPGQVIDALGNTTTFAYRVLIMHKKNGSFVSYRGAYEISTLGEEGLAFVEKHVGRSPEEIESKQLRWENPEDAKRILSKAAQVGFQIVDEGTFVYSRDVNAQELAFHLDDVQKNKSKTFQ